MRQAPCGEEEKATSGGAVPPPRLRFSTRRRLIAAFSAVLVAFLAALAFQIFALRRMEATFAAMEEHDEQMQLALQLEDAVREQYRDEGSFVLGDGARLAELERARSRVSRLIGILGRRVEEPDAAVWLDQIREASEALDRTFRNQVAPAVQNGDPAAAATHEASYARVSLIEDNVDKIFGKLRRAVSSSRQELVERQRTALQLTGTLLVVIPIFVVAAVLYLSRSVAKPLARLSQGAAALASGRLDTRIHIDTPDEFGALAEEFNAMTVALREHEQKLVQSEKLAAVGRLAAGVAHELNNPLQVMLGYLSRNRDVPDRRLAEELAAIEEETLRCKEIVQGLLELSRPSPSLSAVPVDVRALCEDVSSALQASLKSRAPHLRVSGTALALADRLKLRQVVFNLLKNAAEAAGPAGDVDVRIGASGRSVEVTFSDTGPGLAPAAQGRMFEPFFTTKPTGTGLGLAVSRAIARAHGGDIAFADGESGGAVFTLRLPRASEERT